MNRIKSKKSLLLIAIFLFGTILSSAQTINCDVLKILENITIKEFSKGDTIEVGFKNVGEKKFVYLFEVEMFIGNLSCPNQSFNLQLTDVCLSSPTYTKDNFVQLYSSSMIDSPFDLSPDVHSQLS